ncbi:MAG: hypothetical protein M1389_01315 [Chloroflexi bacterium]|nr:hypothetical protein [Chloroflexota bacterium]
MEARRREEEHEGHEAREEPGPQEGRETRERRESIGPVGREAYGYEAHLAERRDFIHWGPVWVGFISSFAVLTVLALLAAAVGLSVVSPAGPGAVAGPSWVTGIASVVAVLISFFVGSWLAGRSTSARTRFEGFALGTMIWALGTVLLVLFAAIGVGGLISIFAAFLLTFSPAPTGVAAQVPAGPAIAALVGVVLAWVFSVLGAIIGTSSRAPEIEG